MSASPGLRRTGHAGARGEDRAHVVGPEPPELRRPVRWRRRAASWPWAAFRAHSSSRSPASVVDPAAAAPLMKASAAGPRAQKAFSDAVFGRTARRGHGLRPAVVVVEIEVSPRGDEVVAGDDLTEVEDFDHGLFDQEPDVAPMWSYRHRVAGRAEADTAQPVDLSVHDLADFRAKRRRARRARAARSRVARPGRPDLRVQCRVHLLAPCSGLLVGSGKVCDR